jgi:hypothetical protein
VVHICLTILHQPHALVCGNSRFVFIESYILDVESFWKYYWGVYLRFMCKVNTFDETSFLEYIKPAVIFIVDYLDYFLLENTMKPSTRALDVVAKAEGGVTSCIV